MHSRRHVELRLELELDADPIAGRLVRDGNGFHRFHGWLELAGALEEALSAGGQAPPGAEPIPAGDRRAKDT